jgi:hypothetical protein
MTNREARSLLRATNKPSRSCGVHEAERICRGEPRGDDPARLEAAQAELAGAIEIGDDSLPARPLLLERIGF